MTSTASSFPGLAGMSPTFAYDVNFQDSDYLEDGFASPSALSNETISPLAQRGASDDGSGPAAPNGLGDSPPATNKAAPLKRQSRKLSSSGGKTKSRESKPKTKSPQSGISLRTANRKAKPASHSDSESLVSPLSAAGEDDDDYYVANPDTERRQRHNHNLVEKQYRNRLNTQFEHLLAALHVEDAVIGAGPGSKGGSGGSSSDQGRRMSKAEVLDFARRHIHALEKERRQLHAERKMLLENVEIMQAAVLRQGLGVPIKDRMGGPRITL